MKTHVLLISFFVAAAALLFTGYSGGPAAAGGIDRTGSPVSGGTCTQCHNGGSGATIVSARLLNAGTPVSSYVPGQVYTLEIQVTNSNYTLFGAQATVLTSSNVNAGTMNTTPLTGSTQVSTLSGRQYIEHDGQSSTGIFQTQWTAPASGTGTVRIYAMGNAVNGSGSGGDQPSSPINIAITESVVTAISYAQSTYCQTGSDPTPTRTGVAGGSYSSASGLVLNASTGLIDLSASTPGTYTVIYTYSGSSTTLTTVTIAATDVATVSYGNSPVFCSGTNQTVNPSITGVQTGTFSATPSGLSIHSSTGAVNIANSAVGTYSIHYITSGTCPTTVNTTLTINASDIGAFNYAGASFCQSGTDPFPTFQGTSQGTFSATPSGLSINSNTGVIDVSTSLVGNYTITFITNLSACPDTHSVALQISAAGNAAFGYAQSAYCANDNDPTPNISGISGGSFSNSPSGLMFLDNLGTVDLSNTAAGTYSIYYQVGGSCPATDSVVLTVNASDYAEITFPAGMNPVFDIGLQDTLYNAAIAFPLPQPIIIGTQGGVFNTSDTLVPINASTGVISVNFFGPTLFTYTTTGVCPHVDSFWVASNWSAVQEFQALSHISVFPNPSFDGQFQLKNEGETAETSCKLYNGLGQLIRQEQFIFETGSIRSLQINSDLPKGLYSLTLQQGNRLHTYKLSYH